MKIIDVASASGVAVLSILLLTTVNPGPMRQQVRDISTAMKGQTAIQSYLAHYGMPFLANATLKAICDSTPTYHVSVLVNGVSSCPSVIHWTDSVTLQLGTRIVVIDA